MGGDHRTENQGNKLIHNMKYIACKIITNFMFASFLFEGARTNLIQCKKVCHPVPLHSLHFTFQSAGSTIQVEVVLVWRVRCLEIPVF